jgi:hypothetical protein
MFHHKEVRDDCITEGLLHSLCIFPLLSYGATAPLAAYSENSSSDSSATSCRWPHKPLGINRMMGEEADKEDEILKVVHQTPISVTKLIL